MSNREQLPQKFADERGWTIVTPEHGVPTFADKNGDPLFTGDYDEAILDLMEAGEKSRDDLAWLNGKVSPMVQENVSLTAANERLRAVLQGVLDLTYQNQKVWKFAKAALQEKP